MEVFLTGNLPCHPEPTTLPDLRRISKRGARVSRLSNTYFQILHELRKGQDQDDENIYLPGLDDEKYIYQVKGTKLCLK